MIAVFGRNENQIAEAESCVLVSLFAVAPAFRFVDDGDDFVPIRTHFSDELFVFSGEFFGIENEQNQIGFPYRIERPVYD